MNPHRIIGIASLVAPLVGCTVHTYAAQPAPAPTVVASATPAPAPTAPPSTITKEEVQGYWTGDWGDMVLRVVGDEIWGAYVHDEGTVRGRIVNGRFYGWWCEVPSRRADADAGEVEFGFARDAQGGIAFDGRWRYGASQDWQENWDLHRVDQAPPAELVARFANAAAFCPHP